MKRFIVLATLLATQAFATQAFSFTYGGRTYTITTQALGHVFSWDSSHWTYEPSVVLPAPQTNYQYVLVFSSGTAFAPNEGIFVTSSYSPTSFPSPPTEVLGIGATSNLCDMIDARPYWDGSIWHVYVQALEWVSNGCNTGPGRLYEATGPSLTSLSWVYDYGTHAEWVIWDGNNYGTTGIGEVMQWYNSLPYMGDPNAGVSALQ
jgi:hypothetical protein